LTVNGAPAAAAVRDPVPAQAAVALDGLAAVDGQAAEPAGTPAIVLEPEAAVGAIWHDADGLEGFAGVERHALPPAGSDTAAAGAAAARTGAHAADSASVSAVATSAPNARTGRT
jgi:hypothetical protein